MKGRLSKKFFIFLFGLFLVGGIFFVAPAARATVSSMLGDVIGSLIGLLISALGLILVLVMKVLVIVAQYSNFIHAPAVVSGWVIVRDVCNMFFVLILLVIAFGTILKLENYSYKKYLPKLILMAILINFSRTICGLLIDFAQVVMLTFVNAFKDVAGGNLVEMLGIKEIVTLARKSDTVNFWTIVGAYVLGLIYMIVALVVIITMVAVLAMRIVMIWIYVVLSPLAYLLGAFPGGQSYASQWWKRFTNNLIVGPVLAFFIWLSFVSLQTPATTDSFFQGTSSTATSPLTAADMTAANFDPNVASGASEASSPGVLIKFIISIGMLIAGLKISQEIGGEAGGLAGKGMGKLMAFGAGFGTGALAFGKKWGKKIGRGDFYVARKFTKAVGVDLRPMKVAEAVKSSFAKSRMKDEQRIQTRGQEHFLRGGLRSVFAGVGAGTDWADNYVDGFMGAKGIWRAGKQSFVYPRRRRELKEQIDRKNEDIEALEGEKAGSISQSELARQRADLAAGRKKEAESGAAADALEQEINSGKFNKGSNEYKEAKSALAEARAGQEGLKKENDAKEEDLKIKTVVDDSEYKELQDEINARKNEKSVLKERLVKAAPPQALESRGEYRKMINESTANYKDMTNADELIMNYDSAAQRGDKFGQIAILEKLSHDANLNEILNEKGYGANAVGLYKFLHNLENDFGKKRGLTGFKENEILRIQNDLGESEERVGHWEMSKMAAMNDKGEFVSSVRPKTDAQTGEFVRNKEGQIEFDDCDHVIAAASEVTKMDPQKILNSLNRLAVGGENGHGQFELANLGRVLIKILDRANTFKAQGSRMQNNLARNLSSPEIMKELMEVLQISPDSAKVINERGGESPVEVLQRLLEIKKAGGRTA